MAGVVLITQPSVIFLSAENVNRTYQALGFVEALISSITGAGCFVILRHIGTRAHALFSVYYMALCTGIAMAFVVGLDSSQQPRLEDINLSVSTMVVGVSVTGWLGTYLCNKGMPKWHSHSTFAKCMHCQLSRWSLRAKLVC